MKLQNWRIFAHALLLSWFCTLLLTPPTKGATLGSDIARWSVPNSVSAIVWSPNGKFLAVSYDEDRKISLFQVSTGRHLWTVEKLTGNDLVPHKVLLFSRDLALIFTSSAITVAQKNTDKTVSVIGVSGGRVQRTLSYRSPPSGQANARAFDLSRDGTRLFVIPGEMGEMIVYDTRSWEIVRTYSIGDHGRNSRRSYLSIDEAQDRFTVAQLGEIQVRKLSTGEELRRFNAFQVGVAAMAINPLTHELVVGGDGSILDWRNPQTGQMQHLEDDPNTLVRAFSPETSQQTHVYNGPGGDVEGISISSDGGKIAATKGRQLSKSAPCHLLIWNAVSDDLLADKECGQGFVRDLTFSPDDKLVAYAVDSTVHIVQVTH